MGLLSAVSESKMLGIGGFGDMSRGGLYGGSREVVSSFSHFDLQASDAEICCLSCFSVPSFLTQ